MMDINLSLVGQIITFVLFVWFTMKVVWPPVLKALKARQEKVASGLAAADRGLAELELARKKAKELIQDAKGEASVIIEKANLRAHKIEEEAHIEARNLAEQMKRSAKAEIDRMEVALRESLSQEVMSLALQGTEKLLSHASNDDRMDWDKHLLEQLNHDLASGMKGLSHG
jgi:F-type H+-transporting ATPase subunit b